MTMTIDKNSACESARTEFLEWWHQEGNALGEGKYKEVAEKVKSVALTQGLLQKDIILHYHWFRFGFPLYYGEKQGEQKFLPIPINDGKILSWQLENEISNSCWPIKDPSTNSYFIPKVTENKIPPPSGSCPTDQYLDRLVKVARMSKDSKEYRILEALTPYAGLISNCGGWTYREISNLVPGYK